MNEITRRRVKANKEIIKCLEDVMKVYPDWRFQQLLMNVGIVDGVDRFYEEPDMTLSRIIIPNVIKVNIINFEYFFLFFIVNPITYPFYCYYNICINFFSNSF